MWEDQSKCKQRTVGTGFTVLRGGRGEGRRVQYPGSEHNKGRKKGRVSYDLNVK